MKSSHIFTVITVATFAINMLLLPTIFPEAKSILAADRANIGAGLPLPTGCCCSVPRVYTPPMLGRVGFSNHVFQLVQAPWIATVLCLRQPTYYISIGTLLIHITMFVLCSKYIPMTATTPLAAATEPTSSLTTTSTLALRSTNHYRSPIIQKITALHHHHRRPVCKFSENVLHICMVRISRLQQSNQVVSTNTTVPCSRHQRPGVADNVAAVSTASSLLIMKTSLLVLMSMAVEAPAPSFSCMQHLQKFLSYLVLQNTTCYSEENYPVELYPSNLLI